MSSKSAAKKLASLRVRIARGLREARQARGWSQADLASELGLSQARLSVIERGGGSISAEQFVVLLSLTNLPIETFLPPQDPEDEVQNALSRLGAFHLQEVPDTVPSRRLGELSAVVRETVLLARSPRLLTALVPVLVWNSDTLNLPTLQVEFAQAGLPNRLPWLIENGLAALETVGTPSGRRWIAAFRRSRVVFTAFLDHVTPKAGAPDRIGPDLRSARALEDLRANRSVISLRWNVDASLQPWDFAEALKDACASG